MFSVLSVRMRQKYRTMKYPRGKPPDLPAEFAGKPVVDNGRCAAGCRACAEVCPTAAISVDGVAKGPRLDMGKCIFCRNCEKECRQQALKFSREFKMCSFAREGLIVSGDHSDGSSKLRGNIPKSFRRSLKLRQVSAGGCNACEADTNVLGTIAWDLGRFGVQFVASPRHADGLLVTGPVTENMRAALMKTYEAVPFPKIVIAVGACAVSGGIYAGHKEAGGVDGLLPVDLYVPGCPPHPLVILDAMLQFLGRP